MSAAAAMLVGEHDFASFARRGMAASTPCARYTDAK